MSNHAKPTEETVSIPGVQPSPPDSGFGIYLYWIPLGAGGSGFVRLNGRIYEAMKARLEGRSPLALYHTALQVQVPEGRFVIETMWPSPDGDTGSRGVEVEAPVFARWLGFTRVFRYEVRCWQGGVLPDEADAVGGPKLLSDDPGSCHRLIGLTPEVPGFTWGRDQSGTGDMWNSNSVISWLLTRTGLPIDRFQAPTGGRAPGWEAGITVALAESPADRRPT